MFNPDRLPVFIFASLVLLVTPGPAVLYIIARSLDQGRTAGLVSVLSVEVGNFFHAVVVSLGLSAVLLSSPTAFNIIKYLGAAYLVYLGLAKLLKRAPDPEAGETPVAAQSLGSIFRQGVTVAILNPKTALFFLAFLPQFVDKSRGQVSLQLLSLGCLFVFMAIISDGLYALLASSARGLLSSRKLVGWVERYVAGFIFVGLGIVAALAGGPG